MNMTLAIILLVVSLVVGIWLVNGVYKLLGISVYVAGHKVVWCLLCSSVIFGILGSVFGLVPKEENDNQQPQTAVTAPAQTAPPAGTTAAAQTTAPQTTAAQHGSVTEQTEPPAPVSSETQSAGRTNEHRYNELLERYPDPSVSSYSAHCTEATRRNEKNGPLEGEPVDMEYIMLYIVDDATVSDGGESYGEGAVLTNDIGGGYCKWRFGRMSGYVIEWYPDSYEDGEYIEFWGCELTDTSGYAEY